MGVTSRLYYTDSYLAQFDATVISLSPDGLQVELDQTAFYPTSGGQLHDLGTLNSIPVTEVLENPDGALVHVLASPLPPGPIHGAIAWDRRRSEERRVG